MIGVRLYVCPLSIERTCDTTTAAPRRAAAGGGGSGSNDDDDGDEHPDNGGGGRRRPCAVVERDAGRGGAVRVHWLRYPESYDEWRPQADVPPGAKEGGGEVCGGKGGYVCGGGVGGVGVGRLIWSFDGMVG